jgi:hypothetical protein
MEPAEIISWALGHSFKQTGVNAYSADYEGIQYQMVLKRDHFICQRVFVNGGTENCSNVTYDGLHIDTYGMMQGAGIAEAFARKMYYSDKPAPSWFPEAYLEHVRNDMMPKWEAISTGMRVR